MDHKIPKKIHYCWFGHGQKNDVIEQCLASWKKNLPDYKIIEWNEDNYPVSAIKKFAYEMYRQKKWAFVSDYARLEILLEHGGIYLDTDMYLLKSFDNFLDNECFFGKEDTVHISAGVIGAAKGNAYIRACKEHYDRNADRVVPIPKVLTEVFQSRFTQDKSIVLYDAEVFYPFTAHNIGWFDRRNPPNGAYAVHMWNYSWGHPLNKFFKKIGIHRAGTKMVEMLGMKKFLKNLFGFE